MTADAATSDLTLTRSAPARPADAPAPVSRHSDVLTAVLLAGALVAAVALRLDALTAVGFGNDEAVYGEQARALARGEIVVRAHPPGWLAVASLLGEDASERSLRLLSVGAGILGVALTAALAATLHTGAPRAAAVVAAWLVAVMPYHVEVSRQFLLDGPAATAGAAMLLGLLRWDRTHSRRWLMLAALAAAAAVLAKESSLLLVAAAVTAGLARPTPQRLRAAAVLTGAAGLGVLAWFLTAVAPGAGGRLVDYAQWQVARGGNAVAGFYAETVPAIGPAVLLAGLGAVIFLTRRSGILLPCAVFLPALFFLLWPVKGYAYLAVVVPALTALAALAVVELWRAGRRRRAVAAGIVVTSALGVLTPTLLAGGDAAVQAPLPGRDGLPGVREAARYVASNGATSVVTSGTAVANVMTFYTDASVSALRHGTADTTMNPAYRDAPAASLADADHLVWDTWTAATHPELAEAVVEIARARGMRVGFVSIDPSGGIGPSAGPAVVVYEVAA